MIILQNDYLKLEHHTDTNTLISCWCRSVTTSEYRKGILQIHKAFSDTHAFYLLHDTSCLAQLDLSEQRWTSETACRNIASSNIHRIAHVVPNEVFHQIITFKIHAAIKEKLPYLEFDVFTDSFSALRWLIAVKANNLRY